MPSHSYFASLKFKRPPSAFIIFFILILLTVTTQIQYLFWNNVGWVFLTQAMSRGEELQAIMERKAAVEAFEKAESLGRRGTSSAKGLGYLQIAEGMHEDAFRNWMDSKLGTEIPLYLSQNAFAQKNYIDSLSWAYLAYQVGKASNDIFEQKRILLMVGRACQKTWGEFALLDSPLIEACETYKKSFDNNLIINGKFEYKNLGWSYSQFSDKSDFYIGTCETGYEECACIHTRSNGYHGGWFQAVSLLPDTHIQFSARVKLFNHDNLEVRLLVMESKVDGKSVTIESHTIDRSMEWSAIETFMVPRPTEEKVHYFYPILVSGNGVVCIDDVKLKVVL